MELTLTPRLQAISSAVPQDARLADVGTDHGYLPVSLLLEKRIEHAVASDLREGPLSRARETARRYGVEGQIDFLRCDGLDGVEGFRPDTVVIAGLGGETIASILQAAPWTKQGVLLLLQPMTHGEMLRGWLAGNGYAIRREHIAREGKYLYSILEVTAGEMPALSPAELWAGRQSDDPLLGEWLDYIAAKLQKALDGQLASKEPDRAAVERLRGVLSGVERMKKEL